MIRTLLLTLTGLLLAASASAAVPASIVLTSQERLWLDANKCNAEGPRGAWLSFVITNTGSVPLTDVTVDFSGFTGTNADYFEAPADTQRVFSTLAPGATQPVYFYVDYAEVCNHSNGGGSPYAGYTANYAITVNAAGHTPVVRAGAVTTEELLSARAAGVAQSSILGPGTFVGQLLTQTVTYSFGNNSDLFFQPSGEAAFPDACIRLVGSQVTATSGGVTGLLGQKDRLAFPTASVPGGGGTVTVTYTWEIRCRNLQVVVHPWAAARSGNKYKYAGFASSAILPSALANLTVRKSASPMILADASTGPVTWTVTFANSASVPVTLDAITDILPACMSILNPAAPNSGVTPANSSAVPSVGATGEVTWQGLDLGSSAASTWRLEPGSTLTLVYTTSVAGCPIGMYTNAATGLQGSAIVGPAAASINIGMPAAIDLHKSVSPATFAIAGQSLTYTFEVRNTGISAPLTGPFLITDDRPLIVRGVSYPAGTPFACGTGPLMPGSATSCTAVYVTTAADVAAGFVTNTATAAADGIFSGPAHAGALYSGSALVLSKAPVLPTFRAAGETVTYAYTVRNASDTVLTGPFLVTDDRIGTPPGTPFSCGLGPLAPGDSTSCTAGYVITSADVTAEYVTNTASVSGNGFTSSPVQATVILAQTPGITIAKTASPTFFAMTGATITYTYRVTNTGNTTLSTITISDNRIGNPAGTSFVCGSGTLAAGASRTCTATYAITAADWAAGTVTNLARASGVSGSGGTAVTVTSEPASATIERTAPELTLAKIALETGFDAVGDVLHYQYVVRNSGNVVITGPILITDDRVDDGVGFVCSTANLAVGSSVACTGADVVTQADLDAGSVTNAAFASGGGIVSNTAKATVTAIQSPALALHKSVSPATFARLNDVLTSTYTIRNVGNVTLEGPFDVIDDHVGIPMGTPFSCGAGPLAPDAITTCTAMYTVTAADLDALSVTNRATATGNGVATSEVSATAFYAPTVLSGLVTDALTQNPIPGATVRVTDADGNIHVLIAGPDGRYTLTDSASTPLSAGPALVEAEAAGYVVAASNPIVVAASTTIQDLMLQHVTLDGVLTDLGSGVPIAGATITVTQGAVTCVTTTGEGGTYHFGYPDCPLVAGPATVSAAATGYEDASSGTAILALGPTVQDLAAGNANLLVTKDDAQTVVVPGQVVDYTITIVNLGSVAALGVTLQDTLPSHMSYLGDGSGTTPVEFPAGTLTWTLGSLAPGASLAFVVSLRVADSLPDGTTRLPNYAWVTTTTAEKDLTNNEVSDVNTVTTHPDLHVSKSATSMPPAGSGDMVSYRLEGGNAGHATATAVTILDVLDALCSFDAGSASLVINGNAASFTTLAYDAGTHLLAFTLPDLSPADVFVITYTVTVGTVSGDLLENTATIGMDQTDLDSSDNVASAWMPTEGGEPVELYLHKAATPNPDPAVAGGQITYVLAYGNAGAGTADGVTITDVLPEGTTLVAGSITGGGVEGSGTITWNLGSLAGTATGTVGFTVRIADFLPSGMDAIANTAVIASDANEADMANNTATVSTPVEAAPDLRVVKTDGTLEVLADQSLVYDITVVNVGHQAATGVQVVDTLLRGITYVDSTPTGVYDALAGTITWDVGAISDQAPVSFVVRVRVDGDAVAGSVAANRATVLDDGANGMDPNPGDNTAIDSDVVMAPFIVVEKSASIPAGNPIGVVYSGQTSSYHVAWYNAGSATASSVIVSDVLPVGLDFVSADGGGTYDPATRTVTWNLGDLAPGAAGSQFVVVSAGVAPVGATQSVSTLSTTSGQGSVTVTSSASSLVLPWCDIADNRCAALRSVYQDTDGTPPPGYLENPRMTVFDDTLWAQPGAASTAELMYWADPATLGAQWVAPNTDPHLEGNYTFFRQTFCLPLNATGLSATLQLAGDDVSDIHLNGVYLGQKIGAGAAATFEGNSGIQSGINLLAVQLLNNRHGGHPIPGCPGCDHIGLLFHLAASFDALRPFAYGPDTVLAGAMVTLDVDELALGGRRPYEYRIDFGDGTPEVPWQAEKTFSHTYAEPGTYTATVTARAVYGCTGTDEVTITVLPASATLLANAIDVSYRDAEGNVFAGTGGTGVEWRAAADVSISKTNGIDTLSAGAITQYTIVVTNAGPAAADGTVLSDPAAEGLVVTGATCTNASDGAVCPAAVDIAALQGTGIMIPVLPAGGSVTFAVSAVVLATNGTVTNTALVALPDGVTDLTPGDLVASDTDVVTPVADLSITKVDDIDPAPVGGLLTYTLQVRNDGPSSATDVVITDTLPSGVTLVSVQGDSWACHEEAGDVICALPGIGMGAVSEIRVVVRIEASASGLLTNRAGVASATFDPDLGNNLAEETTALEPMADLSITKVDDVDPLIAGGELTYTMVVRNAGPSPAQDVRVIESLPVGMTVLTVTGCAEAGTAGVPVCTLGTIPAGDERSYTVRVQVATSVVGQRTNHVTVVASTGDPNPGDNAAAESTLIDAVAHLRIIKTANPIAPSVGNPVTFTIAVTNDGPSDADGVVVTERLASSLAYVGDTSGGNYDPATGTWNVGVLAAGATATMVITATVQAAGQIPNVASITGSYTEDPDRSNDSSALVLNLGEPQADLGVFKTVNQDHAAVGDRVTFTIMVANNGPDTAGGVVIQDVLPAGLAFDSAESLVGGSLAGVYDPVSGLWNIETLAPGEGALLTLRARVEAAGTIVNTASVSDSDVFDPDTTNDRSSVVIHPDDMSWYADLAVDKRVDDAVVTLGQEVTFMVRVRNLGPMDASNVVISEVLPAGMVFVSAVPSQGTYEGGIWTVGVVPASGLAMLEIMARQNSANPQTNTAAVAASDALDPDPGNDVAAVTVTTIHADLAVNKTVDVAAPIVGTDVTFTVTVRNNGPDVAEDVVVTDALPSGYQFVSASASTGSIAQDTWQIGSLSAGAVATLTVTASVLPDGDRVNTATAVSSTYDPTTPNQDTATTSPVFLADVTTAVSAPDTAASGTTVSVTVSFANLGPHAAEGVTYNLLLPAGLDGVACVGATCIYDAVSGSVSITGLPSTLANGENVAITLNYTAPADASVTVVALIGTITGQGDNVAPDTASDTTVCAPLECLIDSDDDGVVDCEDGCPQDPNKTVPGLCGCGFADVDTDGDGALDCNDLCPADPNKTAPGVCGCGFADVDTDGDGAADCVDGCPSDPNKTLPGVCGCGVADTDLDGDGAADCVDGCPNDPAKTAPGACGCGVADTDFDEDGLADCVDTCTDHLGIAGDFNVFVLESYTGFMDVLGNIAAGWNVVGESFEVSRLNPEGIAIVAGGDVTLTDGTVYGDMWIGGTLVRQGVDVQGSRYGEADMPIPVDFGYVESRLQALSLHLSQVDATGTTGGSGAQILLTGFRTDVNVFDVPGDRINTASDLTFDVPAESTVIVNISGTDLSIKQFGVFGGVDATRVLYNAYEATSIAVWSVGVRGSVLAPLAAIQFDAGDWNGTVMARSMAGYGEMHHYPFAGMLPCWEGSEGNANPLGNGAAYAASSGGGACAAGSGAGQGVLPISTLTLLMLGLLMLAFVRRRAIHDR